MKARKIIFLIFLAFSFCFSSYAYTPPPRKVNSDTFNRNVRPLSRNMLAQFYNLLEKISPEQREMIALKQNITQTKVLWDSWPTNCGELSHECSNRLEEIHRRLMRIEKMVLFLERKSYTLNKNLLNHEVDSHLDLMDTLDEMSNQCFQLLAAIEIQLINNSNAQAKDTPKYADLSATLNFMNLDAERSFLNGLSDNLQPHFDFVWNTFLKHLELYVIIQGRPQYFAARVDEFNINWNVFYSKMTSENFALPEGTRFYLQSMHQNWNGILRGL